MRPLPVIGILAVVGLGKSSAARRHLAALRGGLRDIGAPDRIIVFTLSLDLAEETAAAWIATGAKVAVLRGYERQHPVLRVRPEIAGRLLPGLVTREIEATAPHTQVHLVTGRFGKTVLLAGLNASPEETRRRAGNLADCVYHVRWHARRLVPGRVLVVTYKDAEAAFADIPGVEVAHFNAIAGLDCYGDVAALFVIGRPLPRDTDLLDPCDALLRKAVRGSYASSAAAIRMRDGTSCAVQVTRHEDEHAEILRAAICDDEHIQAIGRGRGVNRTDANPLEVHILAVVALPLVHDSVSAWDAVKPDLAQRTLLAGIAVDSPADALLLHPEMFASKAAAEKAFQRALFGGQTPLIIYRGMPAKSAAYHRPGRGRSWQRCYWLDVEAGSVREILEDKLGPIDGWQPHHTR